MPSARPTGRCPPCAASRHHPPAAPPLRGCVPHPCPRTFARPALTIHMLGLGTSGAAGPAQLPEFFLSGPRTRLWPLPSDRGHAPSAQDDVVTSRAPPGPGAPWEWGPELSHPQAWGQGASCLAPRCGVPPSASTPGPPDYSGIPGCGIHKAWASDSVTVKQLKPCLPQSSLRENDRKVMPCPQRSLRHFYPADLQRALAVPWAPNPHSYGWEEIRRAPSGRGTDSHRWI